MRVLWVCVTVALGAAMVAACGSGDTQDAATAGDGGGSGGSAGARGDSGGAGNAGGGGAGGKGGSAGAAGTGGTGGGGGAGGAGGSAGNGGVGGASGSGGGGMDGGAGTTDGGSGSADTGADGAPSDGAGDGAEGAAGSSAGDGSTDSSVDCGVVSDDKRIFVSSALYTGNLGGLTGADSKCQTLADAAGLCGKFKAWLSDPTGDAVDRLTHATGNYVLVSGQIVASGWSGLTSGTLQHAINVTEKNGAAPNGTVRCGANPDVPVWTGSVVAGTTIVMNGSCDNWTGSGGGIFGNGDATNSAWTAMCQLLSVCASTAALYCVEQ